MHPKSSYHNSASRQPSRLPAMPIGFRLYKRSTDDPSQSVMFLGRASFLNYEQCLDQVDPDRLFHKKTKITLEMLPGHPDAQWVVWFGTTGLASSYATDLFAICGSPY